MACHPSTGSGRDNAAIIRLAKGRSRAIRVLKCRHRQHCVFAKSSVVVPHHLHGTARGTIPLLPLAFPAFVSAPPLSPSLISCFVLSMKYLKPGLNPLIQACTLRQAFMQLGD